MAAQRGREPRDEGMSAKKPNPLKLCRHRFHFAWSSGRGAGGRKIKMPKSLGGKTILSKALTFGFRCDRCGEDVERKATPGERKFFSRKLEWPRKLPIHKVWHEFSRRFKDGQDSYRYVGFDLMVRAERWAKKHPKDVRVVGIDDSYFASSLLVLVEHKTTRSYMGTTVVVIPQCTGEKPLEFFLYPGHRSALLDALTGVAAASRTPKRLQREDEIAQARATRKNLRHPAVI